MPAYSFKKRFVPNIRVGLGLPPTSSRYGQIRPELDPERLVEYHPKRQTIRAIGKRRHARPGETVQLYCAMRTKQCFKIGDARCVSVDPIEIDVREHQLPIRVWGGWLRDGRIHDLAQADGFTGGEDMLEFWKKEHGIGNFRGLLIRWEPLP